MNERQSLLDSQFKLFVGAFSNYAGKTLKICVSLTDCGVQTFLEGEGNQYTKRKTESYLFSGFGDSISLGWEWKSTTGRFATSKLLPFTWKISSVGKDKVNQWEFCKLKFTTIVVFVINIQRIFLSQELAPTHSTIVIQGCRFIYFHSFISRLFFSVKGYRVYIINKIIDGCL